MRVVKVKITEGDEGDWWVQSDEVMGLFVCGENKKMALENAKFTLGMELQVDEDEIELDIID